MKPVWGRDPPEISPEKVEAPAGTRKQRFHSIMRVDDGFECKYCSAFAPDLSCLKAVPCVRYNPLIPYCKPGSEEEELLAKQEKLAQLKRLQNLNMHLMELLEKREEENKPDMTNKSSNGTATPAVCPHLSQITGTSNVYWLLSPTGGHDDVDTQPLEDAVAKCEDRLRLNFLSKNQVIGFFPDVSYLEFCKCRYHSITMRCHPQIKYVGARMSLKQRLLLQKKLLGRR